MFIKSIKGYSSTNETDQDLITFPVFFGSDQFEGL